MARRIEVDEITDPVTFMDRIDAMDVVARCSSGSVDQNPHRLLARMGRRTIGVTFEQVEIASKRARCWKSQSMQRTSMRPYRRHRRVVYRPSPLASGRDRIG